MSHVRRFREVVRKEGKYCRGPLPNQFIKSDDFLFINGATSRAVVPPAATSTYQTTLFISCQFVGSSVAVPFIVPITGRTYQ